MSSTDTSTTASDPHAPLLRPHQDPSSASPTSTATLALLIGRATGRRGPSMLVRETAARELEERRVDWGYSKPVVALDMLWNSAFVAVSVIMLIVTIHERPNTPIRVWICGYALQSLVHVILVWLEYRRRNRRRVQDAETSQGMQGELERNGNDSEDDDASNRSSSRSKLASILFVY